MYVACVEHGGQTFRSQPSPDRVAVERAAREAEGWVEVVPESRHPEHLKKTPERSSADSRRWT
jgi:hypothetical protein